MHWSLTDIFLANLPLILLAGAWAFFMLVMRNNQDKPGSYADSLRRSADALERIAAALEKRP